MSIHVSSRVLPLITGTSLAMLLVGLARVTHAGAPAGRYTIPSPGTVYDTKTKLTWQQSLAPDGGVAPTMTQPSAASYCSSLSLNGTGWRLPTVGELQTLMDFSQTGTAALIDPAFFPGAPAQAFWSSTPAAGTPGSAWEVGFYLNGGSNTYAVGNTYNVRCVR